MWDWLVDVVSEFLNQIGEILSEFWGVIKGWWSKLLGYLEKALDDFLEVFIVDQREEGGRNVVEMLRKSCPNSHSLRDMKAQGELLAMGVKSDGTIGEVKDFKAEVKGEDIFDKYSKDENGVVRIKN